MTRPEGDEVVERSRNKSEGKIASDDPNSVLEFLKNKVNELEKKSYYTRKKNSANTIFSLILLMVFCNY